VTLAKQFIVLWVMGSLPTLTFKEHLLSFPVTMYFPFHSFLAPNILNYVLVF
jgi:hypothetical protein